MFFAESAFRKKMVEESYSFLFYYLSDLNYFFALMASYFFCLPQKSNQKEGTQPSRPYGSLALLNKISGHETRPDKPHKTWLAAELRQSLPLLLFCLRYSA